ncbi:MAG: hypothetical protein QHH26_07015 [Armatimonadota bacterium]|nr:hypothetical protein [Armatimonadota bacterium]
MRLIIFGVLAMLISMSDANAGKYSGRYCEGKGDVAFLQLIDQSFGFFHANPDTQNISMLYYPEWDCLIEGFPTWMAWWVQNSYGPTYCSLPFLQEPYLTFLQHSQDMWFKHQGDGKTKREHDLIGPDGCLCDCAFPTGAHMVQGDCNWPIHDWGFEFTAAGVVMQAELLLIQRDKAAIKKYLPNLERACNFIETRRDANGLFLVGPAANLLAPSYGGIRQPDGSFGRGYLAGLSVNYIAACDRMIELFKLVGDKEKAKLYEQRRKITRDSLPLLMTSEGYFVKSMEVNGTKHGVFGNEKYGYFEVAPNVDAICFRVVDEAQANKIYAKIASIPQLRPHDFLITNYPSLDDTYEAWDSTNLNGLWEYGRWVNGGVWSTMEARAIIAYYRLGKYEDVWCSNLQSMKFVRDYQMDAPLTNFGDDIWFKDRLTNLCYDALGIPAATIRGLFEYVYKADSLTLYPHLPAFISEYVQKEPIRFGEKRIFIAVKNNGPEVKTVKVNGKIITQTEKDRVVLPFASLPKRAQVEITMTGEWPRDAVKKLNYKSAEGIFGIKLANKPKPSESFTKPLLSALNSMMNLIKEESNVDYELAFLTETINALQAYDERVARDAAGEYRQFSPEKRVAILNMYKNAAMNMYNGFDSLMKRYASSNDPQKRKLSTLYSKLQE